MPELPEVETVRLTLSPLIGREVVGVWSSGKALRLGKRLDLRGLKEAAVGRTVEDVRRIGKYLLIDFRGGAGSTLVHLGMSGRLRLMDRSEPPPAHTHVVWRLDGGQNTELRFSDPRRFGQVGVALRGRERQHPALAKLGPDPLTDGISAEHLYERAHRAERAIKLVLLDQTVIAGIGNIYASEALHRAGIHPSLRGRRLSRARTKRLAAALEVVLERSLDRGGTSLRDFVNADGHKGDNSHYLLVYDREGARCPRRGCTGTIRRTVLQGRATFHCPTCQKR